MEFTTKTEDSRCCRINFTWGLQGRGKGQIYLADYDYISFPSIPGFNSVYVPHDQQAAQARARQVVGRLEKLPLVFISEWTAGILLEIGLFGTEVLGKVKISYHTGRERTISKYLLVADLTPLTEPAVAMLMVHK